jgi:hypothetical protein
MRHEPQATGGSHDPDYVGDSEFPTILVADVDRSHAIPVPDEPAALVCAAEDAAHDLAPPVPALRAGTAGVRFLLQDDFHPQALGLVGQQEAHAPMRPLVYLLVIFRANIGLLSQITHVANDQRSHACLVQRGDKSRGLLVLNLPDLVLDFLELFLLGADDPLAALGALLHTPIDAAVQFRLQLVAVLHFGTQEPPVEDMRLRPIVGGGHMYFAQVDARHLVAMRVLGRFLQIGRNGLVLGPCPVNDDGSGQLPGPGEDERDGIPPVGEAQRPIFQHHRGAFVFNPEVALALMWGLHIGVARLFTFLPGLETGKEGLHAGVGGVGVQFGRGMPAHQVLRLQPDTFVPDGAPEGDERLAIEPPALLREFIQLFACADLHTAYLILLHREAFFLSTPKTVMGSKGDTRAKAPYLSAAFN